MLLFRYTLLVYSLPSITFKSSAHPSSPFCTIFRQSVWLIVVRSVRISFSMTSKRCQSNSSWSGTDMVLVVYSRTMKLFLPWSANSQIHRSNVESWTNHPSMRSFRKYPKPVSRLNTRKLFNQTSEACFSRCSMLMSYPTQTANIWIVLGQMYQLVERTKCTNNP